MITIRAALRYLGQRHPYAGMFRRLEQRLRKTRAVWPTANEDAINVAVELEPWSSRELGIHQPRILEVLHDDQLQPYHYSRSTHLFPNDRPVRM